MSEAQALQRIAHIERVLTRTRAKLNEAHVSLIERDVVIEELVAHCAQLETANATLMAEREADPQAMKDAAE